MEFINPKLKKYTALDIIGSGAQGKVYKVCDYSGERFFALKIVNDNKSIERFVQEIDLLTSLRHPSIVVTYEADTDPRQPFILMEYVPGKSLEDFIQSPHHDILTSTKIITNIVEALVYLHDKNILHRDIKPSNIFVKKGERSYVGCLGDFGIAKGDLGANLTQTDGHLGTLLYLPPELVADHKKFTPQSDIYALGISFYESLTGIHPYQTSSILEFIQKISQQEVAAPYKINPNVSESISNICLKAIARNMEDRYQSAEQMLNDLILYQQELTSSLSPTIEENTTKLNANLNDYAIKQHTQTSLGYSVSMENTLPATSVGKPDGANPFALPTQEAKFPAPQNIQQQNSFPAPNFGSANSMAPSFCNKLPSLQMSDNKAGLSQKSNFETSKRSQGLGFSPKLETRKLTLDNVKAMVNEPKTKDRRANLKTAKRTPNILLQFQSFHHKSTQKRIKESQVTESSQNKKQNLDTASTLDGNEVTLSIEDLNEKTWRDQVKVCGDPGSLEMTNDPLRILSWQKKGYTAHSYYIDSQEFFIAWKDEGCSKVRVRRCPIQDPREIEKIYLPTDNDTENALIDQYLFACCSKGNNEYYVLTRKDEFFSIFYLDKFFQAHHLLDLEESDFQIQKEEGACVTNSPRIFFFESYLFVVLDKVLLIDLEEQGIYSSPSLSNILEKLGSSSANYVVKRNHLFCFQGSFHNCLYLQSSNSDEEDYPLVYLRYHLKDFFDDSFLGNKIESINKAFLSYSSQILQDQDFDYVPEEGLAYPIYSPRKKVLLSSGSFNSFQFFEEKASTMNILRKDTCKAKITKMDLTRDETMIFAAVGKEIHVFEESDWLERCQPQIVVEENSPIINFSLVEQDDSDEKYLAVENETHVNVYKLETNQDVS